MKVLLLKPNAKVYRAFNLGKKLSTMPPLGLLCIASYAEKQGHEVKVLDANAKNLDNEHIMAYIKDFKPDVAGLSATTPEVNASARVMSLIKDNFPSVSTVLGGPHASAIPEETLKEFPCVDFIITKEGEYVFARFLDELGAERKFENVDGLVYRDHGSIVKNPPGKVIEDINSLPLPARHLIDADDYKLCLPGKGHTRSTMIQTIRGCPFKCVFCYRSKESARVRFRQPELVVDEIEECIDKYEIKTLVFCDDTFSLHKSHVHAICDEIIKRNLNISWYCSMRANDVTVELVSKMKKAGLVMVSLGVETGSREQLELIGKKTTLESYQKAYDILRGLNMETRASFVLGLPHDTKKTIAETISFAKELNIYEAFFNISTPYPGSVLYDKGKAGDGFRIVSHNWSEYRRFGNAVIELNGISRSELIRLQKKAFIKFYLRGKIIWHHVKYYLKYGHFVRDYKPVPFRFLVNLVKGIPVFLLHYGRGMKAVR